jgi:hydroxymethylbilane synthase
MVATALRAVHGWSEQAIEIVVIRTTGDRIQDRALADVGGKALWTKELDRALFDREIDFAVHSMKDVETIRPAGITIAAMLPRADVRDRLIGCEAVDRLRHEARVGTSSPRRAAQLRRIRPDLQITLFRGNVETRLRKLAEGEADATLLAAAGLDRLGRPEVGHAIPVETMLPAPAQGAVGIETLRANAETIRLIQAIDDSATHRCVAAERAFLAALGADCRSPVAALAIEQDGTTYLRAELLSQAGEEHVSGQTRFPAGDEDAPAALGRDLLARAAPALRALFAS